MPCLEDTLEEAEANDCAADCAADEATCCLPARGTAGSAAATARKAWEFDADRSSDSSRESTLGNWASVFEFSGGGDDEIALAFNSARIPSF